MQLLISNFDEYERDESYTKAFKIAEKIEYNSLKRNKCLVEEYCKYFGKINTLYGELENQGSFKKEKLLRNIKLLYLQVKGKYVNGQDNEIEIIQNNADNIYEDIENKLQKIH